MNNLQNHWLEKLVLLPEEIRSQPTQGILADNLLVSAPSKQGMPGGLYYVEKTGWLSPPRIRQLDGLETSGIWLQSNLFLRSLQNMSCLFIVAYSETGQIWNIINTELKNIHDIIIFKNALYVVSCGTNEIARISMTGEIEERWKFGNGGHTWHINCLTVWDDRLVASCSGRFETEPDWEIDDGQNTGHAFDVMTGEKLWAGFNRPHLPAQDSKGRKYICDSKTQRLLIKDLDDSVREIHFPGTFPKALAWGKEHLYVGLARYRFKLEGVKEIASAQIAILDRETFKIVDYVPLPCSEMYNIVVVPDDLKVLLPK